MTRVCENCGKEIKDSGFVLDPGTTFFCDENCLFEIVSPEDYEKMTSEGLAYFTKFEEEINE